MALLEGDFSRIWFWDGKAWEFKDLPKNKFDFLDYRDRCFYDPNRDIIIYVGNEDGGKAGVGLHVYEFDWYNWKRIKTLEKGIEISNIYYNPSINKTVLIEYNHKKKVTDGLWEYDGKTLKRRSIPPIKGYPGLSYYNSKKNLYFRLVTGDWDPHSSKDFVDPWQFDGEKWQKAHFEFPHDLFWGFPGQNLCKNLSSSNIIKCSGNIQAPSSLPG